MAEWFEEWFGEEYLRLYPHRDDRDAERLVGLLTRMLPWRPGWRVLDVGCGAGRHARALAAAGARVVGVDLSLTLLRRAATTAGCPLARADMRRLPVRPASMDATMNLFTSFGYFTSDAEHHEALRQMVETVRPGGWFVLDFLHAPTVRERLVPRDRLQLDGAPVEVERRLEDDGRYVVKRFTLPDGRRFTERVRLFEPADLAAMLAAAGVSLRHEFGDYDGGPLGPGAPRVILAGTPA